MNIQLLKDNYNKLSIQELMLLLGCGRSNIYQKVRDLNLPFKVKATHEYNEQIKPLMNRSGVYKITNLTNGRFYIGSSDNVGRRLKSHCRDFFYNRDNKHSKIIQADYDAGHKFKFEIIFENDDSNLIAIKEMEYIKDNSKDKIYNKTILRSSYPVTESSKEVFQRHIKKLENGCWIWTGLIRDDYGLIKYKINSKIHQYRAHKFSYFLHKGEIPSGLLILHSCDNKLCVNPDHLTLGSDKKNAKDRVERGTIRKSRFTKEDVQQMRKLKEEGQLYTYIGKQFNTHPTHAQYLLDGRVKSVL